MNKIERLKEKWGLSSLLQVVLVLLTFSLAGSSVVVFRKFFFSLLGFDENTEMWVKTIAYIIIVFPAYQVLLLGYGTLLGQFRFFWEKEKKLFQRIASIGKKKKPSAEENQTDTTLEHQSA